jgi:putative tryptophan/tyrosine transport system substrate-binding protein
MQFAQLSRRNFISLAGGAAIASLSWPVAARAQPAGKVSRVGLILTTSPVAELAGSEPTHPLVRTFVRTLRILGHIEGQNLVLERRSAEGRFERFRTIVAELVGREIDVIVTVGDDMAIEARRVTKTVPIVMATSTDPVGAEIVASLARPGGNVTGFTTNAGPEIEAKRLQLLKEALPQISRVAYLGTVSDWENDEAKGIRNAARTLGVTLVHAAHSPTHYADAFALIIRERPHALLVARSPANYANRQAIVAFAIEHRIPSNSAHREFVEAGGLMSYGVNVSYLFRRAAGQVDKILKGATPADLPVEQPTRFEFVINLKTVKALSLEIPPALLISADEVIE